MKFRHLLLALVLSRYATVSFAGELAIKTPADESSVCAHALVTVSPAAAVTLPVNSKIWIVINPVATPGDFWVQNPGQLAPNGMVRISVNFGEPGANVGAEFLFRAFAFNDPHKVLEVGKSRAWPDGADHSSNEVHVIRGKC